MMTTATIRRNTARQLRPTKYTTIFGSSRFRGVATSSIGCAEGRSASYRVDTFLVIHYTLGKIIFGTVPKYHFCPRLAQKGNKKIQHLPM